MKILVAGASGAIGQPLMRLLKQEQYDVYGITQSESKSALIAANGATPLLLNVLDREAVFSSISSIQPDIIIDMLTRLPNQYTPKAMSETAPLDAKIRLEGGLNLLSAAECYKAKRYIVQSCGFWYAPGIGQADENTPFALQASSGIAAGAKLYAEIEHRLFQSKHLEGVALRFGFFYGPGTWFNPDGNVAEQIRNEQFPIIGKGEGIWNFIHIEDAAQAINSAIKAKSGPYNIVNDQPSLMCDWLPAFSRYIGAKHPPVISEEEGLKESGADRVYYATKLRAASNAKAKQEFNFQPRPFEWFQDPA